MSQPSKSIKRNVSGELQIKKEEIMSAHEVSKEKCQYPDGASSSMKCGGTAAEGDSMKSKSNIIPELSDEELLEMALMFEKQQQQQQQ